MPRWRIVIRDERTGKVLAEIYHHNQLKKNRAVLALTVDEIITKATRKLRADFRISITGHVGDSGIESHTSREAA